ncbi:MAG: hypothetical protein WB383_02685 [Acidimicrobiales bacterium]
MSTFEPQMPADFAGSITGYFHATVHSENGLLWIEITEMPGCFASGETMDELIEALTEAMSLYMTSSGVTVEYHDVRLVPIEHPDRLLDVDRPDEYKVLVGA